jgi:hypothetical protein
MIWMPSTVTTLGDAWLQMASGFRPSELALAARAVEVPKVVVAAAAPTEIVVVAVGLPDASSRRRGTHNDRR